MLNESSLNSSFGRPSNAESVMFMAGPNGSGCKVSTPKSISDNSFSRFDGSCKESVNGTTFFKRKFKRVPKITQEILIDDMKKLLFNPQLIT